MSAGAYRKILATGVTLLLMRSIILFMCCSDLVKCCLVNNERLCSLYFSCITVYMNQVVCGQIGMHTELMLYSEFDDVVIYL